MLFFSHSARLTATSVAVLLCLAPVQASYALAGKHVHGHGQLLVAQDANNWQLEFSIPAADLLGFEHAPESDEQVQKVHSLEKKISDAGNVFTVNGNCQLASQDIDFPLHGDDHDDMSHHDEHEEEHHDETHHDAHHHENVKLAYQLTCGEAISEMTVTLFELAPSLSALEVQWINAKGQGMTDATPQSATVTW